MKPSHIHCTSDQEKVFLLCREFRWIKEHELDDGQAFRGNGKLTVDQLELRRLQEENKRLKMEKEILKKAAAFFAQEMK